MDASASHHRRKEAATSSSEPSRELEQMSPDLPETGTTSMEWTDEKHSLYLESMEASFVNQLYDSMDMLGWRSQNDTLEGEKSKQYHRTPCAPSGQFKVLRDGNWKKLSFERPNFHKSRVDDSSRFLTSSWIQHFRPPKVQAELPSSNWQQHTNYLDGGDAKLCHEVVFGGNTEVSDQNFVDEDVEPKGRSTRNAEETSNSWSTDQVVPHREPHVTTRTRGSSDK